MRESDSKAFERLFQMVSDARRLVSFTGAGISTECGVPDFRSPDSPWTRNRPIPFNAFLASEEARREAWRRKFAMDDEFAGAEPGRGHKALAHLVRSGRSPAIVTQNIDGLHQASGLDDEQIVELHGNGGYATCLDCGRRHELGPLRRAFEAEGSPPRCEACGGHVKSATISFGQAMPQRKLMRARELAETCDLFLVAGSSLVVYPAAALPLIASRAGAKVVIVNGERTEFDDIAALVVRADIGSALEPLLKVGAAS
jgi:NAD-dependent deacetylase